MRNKKGIGLDRGESRGKRGWAREAPMGGKCAPKFVSRASEEKYRREPRNLKFD